MNRTLSLATLALAAAALPAQAGFNDPIAFDQAGSVTLTLDYSEGGFDHILDLSDILGPIGSPPLMALTALGEPSPDVLGYTPATAGEMRSLGSYGAGQEIVLRITNVESFRLGEPGNLGDQVFTGSASGLNPEPMQWYSFVEAISPTEIRVRIEDLFPTDPGSGATSLDGYDLQFTLTLQPVPEPGVASLLLAGLAATTFVARRRRG
jgi:hypothetical protein